MTTHLARICVLASLAAWAHGNLNPSQSVQRRVPKQIHTKAAVVETEEDHDPAETHFGGEAAAGHHGHGKYFMYQHVPHKDHYEFGYRRGNDHHFKERYEKAHPHHGHFKTKARWGDKHGGYGEHYWDYNHGGHHGDDEGSDDEGGDGSNPVPDYHLKGEDQDDRVKREPEGGNSRRRRPSDSKKNFDHGRETVDTPALQGRRPSDSTETYDHGREALDTPEDQPLQEGSSRRASASAPLILDHPGLSLAYDTESGTVVDEATGRRFLLTPIN